MVLRVHLANMEAFAEACSGVISEVGVEDQVQPRLHLPRRRDTGARDLLITFLISKKASELPAEKWSDIAADEANQGQQETYCRSLRTRSCRSPVLAHESEPIGAWPISKLASWLEWRIHVGFLFSAVNR